MKENYRELSIIAENLANLYEDGISMDLSFELLSELHFSKNYKNSLKEIKVKILKGYSLAEVFGEYSNLYPVLFVGIISIGENSGELNKCLRSISKYYYEIDKVKRNIKAELRYPLIIFISLMLLSISAFFIIIPNIYETFSSISSKVPKIIKACYDASDWICNNPIISFVALLSWSIVIYLLGKSLGNRVKSHWSSIFLKIKYIRDYYEYMFILLLTVILSSGIQLTKGIELCIDSVNIKIIRNALCDINEEILKGSELNRAIKDISFLSKYTYSMIYLGERSGNLTDVLNKTQERLENSITEKMKRVVTFISPLFIGLMSLLILLFIVSFIMPLIDMVYSGYM
ncbi:type II secretion system F family protein [Clostridium sp. HBUAS56017]|uniref:type II secretion system F family protein n=1 Tax=Clostridium sp. HBUAS56017 TaxID=2571128 RepID=UPI001177764A|nr:type II secretion system F family protein [Clostridium sp. HBUAS56017]